MNDATPLNLLSVFPDVLTPDECQSFILLSERIGYAPAPVEGAFHGPLGFVARDGRDNSRAAVEDDRLAGMVWERVAGCAPARIDGRRAVGLNERLRFYRYAAGQSFGAHTDGYYLRANGEQSLLTLMVYLNAGYAGGETFFLESEKLVIPQAGMALIFAHRLWHAGRVVTDGCKYVLRTDIMYEPERRSLRNDS